MAYLTSSLLCLLPLTWARSIPHLPRDPNNGGTDLDWDAARSKATAFAAQLNLTAKVDMVTGSFDAGNCIGNIGPIERLSFRGLCFADGPAGVNRAALVSAFPSGLATAATWDRPLIYQRGLAIGAEFRGKGINVHLGPVAGPMGRHPLGGRNWEGFGPDPYLSGVSMAATVLGIQQNGVQTSSKHFIGNGQETQRSKTTTSNGIVIDAISSNIDERTLHELYLWPFADAIKAGTTSVMCSYNRLNSTYSCENAEILNDILKKELGFRGYVVSDWYATPSTSPAANAGLDMEMPGKPSALSGEQSGYFFGPSLLSAMESGKVSSQRLDDMVTRVLVPYFLLSQDNDYPTVDPSTAAGQYAHEVGLPHFLSWGYPLAVIPGRDVRGDHAALIRKLGAAGIVLLKNENDALPLHAQKHIAVFGNDAPERTFSHGGDDLVGWDIGTLYVGGGSGAVRIEDSVAPLDAIKERVKHGGGRVSFITNNTDILVVNDISAWCNKTVIITHSSGVNTMPWARHPNITAILAAHYPGEQSGNSIVDVLWGEQAPSGRLPYTIPDTGADYGLPILNLTNVTDPNAWQSDFAEGQLIDYKRFDALNITPLYEFGFGLTYTSFDIASAMAVKALVNNPAANVKPQRSIEVGGNPELWDELVEVNVNISNTGSRAGEAVPQLYASFPSKGVPAGTPAKVLRGFEKIPLNPSESKTVTFRLRRRDLSFWDVVSQTWVLPVGEFTFWVGFSSSNLRSEKSFAVRTDSEPFNMN